MISSSVVRRFILGIVYNARMLGAPMFSIPMDILLGWMGATIQSIAAGVDDMLPSDTLSFSIDSPLTCFGCSSSSRQSLTIVSRHPFVMPSKDERTLTRRLCCGLGPLHAR